MILVVPVLHLARLPSFELHWVWYLAAATVYVQLAVSLVLLRREFGKRLGAPGQAGVVLGVEPAA